MNLFLGDRITVMRNDTWVTAKVRGIILDKHGELERIYFDSLESAFYLADGWKITDESEEWEFVSDEEEEN
jgi:hypothetical protein